MTYSMTAFARLETTTEIGKLIFEMRSVNHRYLDLGFRLPEIIRELEPDFREAIKAILSRGKVEVNVRVESSDIQSSLEINQALAADILGLHHKLYEVSPEIAPIDFMSLLKWPGILSQTQILTDAIKKQIIVAFEQCIEVLLTNRQREGNALAQTVMDRLTQCEQYLTDIKAQYPAQLVQQKQKLTDRLKDIAEQLDTLRVEQEMVLLAQKLDIAEEIDRLSTHINEFRRMMSKGGQVGRRMDFLLQEMNREANTMASKAIDANIQHMVVEIKVLLEQIREQAQNIE